MVEFNSDFDFFQDLEGKRQEAINEYDISDLKAPEVPEDNEDISQYKFAKFAATYFQGNVTHHYLRRVLKSPLLGLKNEGDQLVRSVLMIVIFIGDCYRGTWFSP